MMQPCHDTVANHEASTLVNGANLHFFDQPGAAMAEVRIVIPLTRYTAEDTALSSLLGATVLSNFDPEQAATRDQLLDIGAEFSVTPMPDRVLISGVARTDSLIESVRLVLASLHLAPSDHALAVVSSTESIRSESLRRLSSSQLRSALNSYRWGDHPLHREIAASSQLGEVNSARYAQFVLERVGSRGSLFVVVADRSAFQSATAKDLFTSLESLIGRWLEQSYSDQMPIAPSQIKGGRHVVATSESPNAKLRYVSGAPQRADRDHIAFRVASVILGGYSGSRLVRQLRDRDGTIYQATAGTEDLRGASTHSILIDCPPAHAGDVEGKFVEAVSLFCQSGPTEAELDAAVRYVTASSQVLLGPASAFASAAAGLLMSGGSIGYWENTERDARNLGVADVTEAANRYLAVNKSLLGVTRLA